MGKTKRNSGCLSCLVILGLLIVGLIALTPKGERSRSGGEQVELNRFTTVGYYKNEGHRVLTIEYKAGTTSRDIETYAKQQTHTAGRLFAMYFYPEGRSAPADGVTLAKDVWAAVDAIDTPGADKWSFLFRRNLNGSIDFEKQVND